MSEPTPAWSRRLATAIPFVLLIWADVALVTHAEDTVPSAAASTQSPSAHGANSRFQKITVDERVQRLTETLSLSAQQQGQVRTILARRQQEVERLQASTSPSAVERVHMFRAIDERTVEQIKGVLSDEQRQKYPAPRAPADGPHEAGPGLVAAPLSGPSP